VREKHSVRKYLHPQLAELWQQHPLLREQRTEPVMVSRTPSDAERNPGKLHVTKWHDPSKMVGAKPFVEHVADNYAKFGFRFVPLVSKENGLTCSLDILFLRRDTPGNLVRSGGDIDNRIKTLLDGLRIPDSRAELGGFDPAQEENPFFCLLDDDRLITGLNVTTDRLLLPLGNGETVRDVELIILVKTKIIDPGIVFVNAHSN
jgi:hypothetical protein